MTTTSSVSNTNKEANDDNASILLNDLSNNCQYPKYLSIFGYLFFCGLYVLATLLPFFLLSAVICLYYGYISNAVFMIIIGGISLDFIVPNFNGSKPNTIHAQKFARFVAEGGSHYFPAKSICNAKLEKDKSYILASWPHGLLGGAGHFCFTDFHKQGFHPICSGASIIKYVPFLRRIMCFIGYVDVSKQSLKKVLDVDKYGPTYPHNIVHLVVGGIGEMFYTTSSGSNDNKNNAGNDNNKNVSPEQIIISKRKGFIKLAIETGADIVPHYTFGANQTYIRTFGPKSTMAKLSSALQVSLVFWYGRYNIPMGLLPFQVPVLSVMGEVFKVPKISKDEKITSELVERVHSEFCACMKTMFNKYKVVYVKKMNAPKEWLTKELIFDDEIQVT